MDARRTGVVNVLLYGWIDLHGNWGGVAFAVTDGVASGLVVLEGLCFVADAITRLTNELREQSQCAEAVETMRRRGTLPQTNRGGGDQLDDGIHDELRIKAD